MPEAIAICLRGRFGEYVSGKDLILHLLGRFGVDGANYKALEFGGPGVAAVSIESRLAAANMAVEAGAKAGLFPADESTLAYEGKLGLAVEPLAADAGAPCAAAMEIDLAQLQPQVAYPPLPANSRDIAAAEADRIPVDQVVIGSCSNGRLEDLREAAGVLRGRKVHERVRCLVIPGSQRVYREALREGLIGEFIDAGCAVSTPTCGPCLGGHMGILAEGERALATTNRNFVGRMGHPQSEVYLANPALAAAAAVSGLIVHPSNL